MSPEHIHLALNHLPFLGLGLAVIPILIGILGRNRGALGSGLLLAAVCGWSVVLVMDSGEEAYERYENSSRHGIVLDSEAREWMEVHEEDAESLSFLMYAAAGVASVALVLCITRMSGAFLLSWIAVLLCLASLAAGILIADSGGKIRRVDFRDGSLTWSAGEGSAYAFHGGLDVPA